MPTSPERKILQRAESLWREGRYDDAWLAIEELEPIDRIGPAVLDLRLRICHSSANWKTGDCLVQVLRCSLDETRLTTCSQYLHDRAAAFVDAGEIGRARETVRDAISLWQPVRYAMVDDARLDGCL